MNVPNDFCSRPLSVVFIKPQELVRIFRPPLSGANSAIYYSRHSVNRFDAPKTLPESARFGVTYAAFDLATCFAETITREDNRRDHRLGGIAVSESVQITTRMVANLSATTLLRLVDVSDVGLYMIGAESGTFNSPIYRDTTQPWAAAIYERPEQVDGLLYRSRFLNGRFAVAIFERGGHRVGLYSRSTTALSEHADYPKTLSDLRVCLLP